VALGFLAYLPELSLMKTYYDILGVPPQADQEEVKSAFRKVVKAVHPDLNGGDRLAEQRSKQINRAYEVLKDPKLRERYDSHLRSKRSRLRMLAITMLVSAGLVSSATLLLLSFFIKPDTGATVARISTPMEDGLAGATALADRNDRAAAPLPAVISSASVDAQSAQAVAERQATWLKIEEAGGPEEIWAFVRANPGTSEAALGAKRLQKLVEAANGHADLSQGASAPAQPAAIIATPALAAEPAKTFAEAGEASPMPSPSTVADAREAPPQEGPKASEVPNPPSAANAAAQTQQPAIQPEQIAEAAPAPAVAEPAAPSALAVMEAPSAGNSKQTATGKDMATAALQDQSPATPQTQANSLAEHPPRSERPASAHDGTDTKLATAGSQSIAHQDLSATAAVAPIPGTPVARDNAPLAPGNADYYLQRAGALVRRGDLERALADYDAAILLNDVDIIAFHERGMLHWRRGETELALADFDRAIRLSFSDPGVYLDRGKLWYERGRYDRAIADFNQAIKLAPSLASAYSYRGTALRRKGEFTSAIADLDQAIKLNPAIPEAYKNLDLARTQRADPLDTPTEAKN
jgi:curved DNA-binding protein CbpA/Flp pilus assembly protein TadD